MQVEKILIAIEEARRFIDRAEAAVGEADGEAETSAGVASAACRRASLDLTRSLAVMRRPRQW